MAVFGDPGRWLIVKREGVWAVCPPSGDRRAGVGGGVFGTGAKALAAFAACAPLRVDLLTEACRQYEWRDTSGGSRWQYFGDAWYWSDDEDDLGSYVGDENDVEKLYPGCGPYARVTGPGVPA